MTENRKPTPAQVAILATRSLYDNVFPHRELLPQMGTTPQGYLDTISSYARETINPAEKTLLTTYMMLRKIHAAAEFAFIRPYLGIETLPFIAGTLSPGTIEHIMQARNTLQNNLTWTQAKHAIDHQQGSISIRLTQDTATELSTAIVHLRQVLGTRILHRFQLNIIQGSSLAEYKEIMDLIYSALYQRSNTRQAVGYLEELLAEEMAQEINDFLG